MIQLTRPIIFFDLETTGTNTVTDKIIQFAGIKLLPDGTRETHTLLLNPGVSIPAEASAVHGITDDMVGDQPQFREIAHDLFDWMDGCDIAGYNSNNFDIPFLCEEFGRCEIARPSADVHLIDVLGIERIINSHKLTETYKRYYGVKLTNAHNALADTQATLDIWMKQMDRLPELHSIEAIEQRSQSDRKRYDIAGKMYESDGVVYRSFGKYKNKPVHEDLSYCQRVMGGDFPYETKVKLKEWIER